MKVRPLALVLLLSACATPHSDHPAGEAGGRDPKAAETRIADAATTPLSDLNLMRAEIPAVLQAAQKGAYAVPADKSCPALAAEIQALDAALGPDIDAPAGPEQGIAEKGAGMAGDAAIGALRGFAEGIVPFRSWVRKLTGAERYSREVSAAIAAGLVRRAYLKGLGQAAGCPPPPATPAPAPVPAPATT